MLICQAATPLQPVPFDALAEAYDDVFTNSRIGRAQRDLVWRELERAFHTGQQVLEINCGTGEDAIFLARRGVSVVACDVSSRMIEVAQRRVTAAGLQGFIKLRVVATEDIRTVEGEGPFDGVFSDFGGLNCVADLRPVACDLARMLKPGATALLSLLGPWCAWEMLWYLLQGNFRKAFRRLHRGGVMARLGEGANVRIRYPSVRHLARVFSPEFRLRWWRGIGVAVPPSYMEPMAQRFPRVLDALASADRWLGRVPVVRGAGDHVLLTFDRARKGA